MHGGKCAKVFKRQVNGSHEIEEEEEEDENCGVVTPSVRHYIHGGKQTMIEQWPWQVIHFDISFTLIFLFFLLFFFFF